MKIHYRIPENVNRATIDIIFRDALQIRYISPDISVKKSGGESEIVKFFKGSIETYTNYLVFFNFEVFNLLKVDNSSSERVNHSNTKLVLDYNRLIDRHKVINLRNY